MARVRKRRPVAPGWARDAWCKGEDPGKWDLDSAPAYYKLGRSQCIRRCPVRVACLRTALQASDPPTSGVVRGGVLFDDDQLRKKKSECVLCGFPIAPLVLNEDGSKAYSLCWICTRFAPCLGECGRLVRRKPNVGSYFCKQCSN